MKHARMGPWTDAHCHLADPRLEPELAGVIARSRDAGVVSWIQGGVGPDDWAAQQALVDRFGSAVKVVCGLHPWWVAESDDEAVERGLAALDQVLDAASALGELGLDKSGRRRKDRAGLERQRRAFIAQLDIAARRRMPLVLHVVRAHEPVLTELERRAPLPAGGLVHAFGGTARDAERYVALGFHLSLGGGLIGRPERARALAGIPVERIVIETDAPDQAPRQWGVDANEPAYLPRIAEALAPIWGLSGPDLLDRAHRTLETVFAS